MTGRLVEVSVPASAANLGPGYDALAVALDLPLTATALERQPRRVLPTGEGAAELPAGDDNLVWRALLAYCRHAGVAVPDVSVGVASAIPLERGLGSSSAAAVAGVVLARALTGAGGRDEDLFRVAAELEGHPDNAAAALYGGLVLVVGDSAQRVTPTAALRPVVCVPPSRQATGEARKVLPETVGLAAAAANGARCAAVLAALAGLLPLSVGAMTDVLHEPPRLALMAGSGEAVRRLRAAGVPACLSGAGPTVLAVLPTGSDAQAREDVAGVVGDGFAVEALRWHLAGARARAVTRAFSEHADTPRA